MRKTYTLRTILAIFAYLQENAGDWEFNWIVKFIIIKAWIWIDRNYAGCSTCQKE